MRSFLLPCSLVFVVTLGSACNLPDEVEGPVTQPPAGDVDAGTDSGTPPADAGMEPPEQLAPEIGTGTRDSVELTEIVGYADGLRRPRDLKFNPRAPDELWVVNGQDDSAVIVTDASLDTRTSIRRRDPAASHFMPTPSSIAFGSDATTIGKEGTFGTCHESRDPRGAQQIPTDFMGPVLWSSDLSVFAVQNPAGLGSHLDMLHGSPNCMGIAWERDNVYWVFGGKAHQGGTFAATQMPVPAIVKYDFGHDHGIGQDDHSDGTLYQYVTNEVSRVPGVPSHLVFDHASRRLYIADTGNSRITALDTESGTAGADLQGQETLVAYKMIDDAILTDIVPAATGLLDKPSGLALKNGLLYVADNGSGWITAFDLEGKRVNYLETGLPAGALAGITFGPDGKLYLVDMESNRVLRIDPK